MPLFKPTVDRALSGMSKAVARLERAIDHHQAEASRAGEAAAALVSKENEELRAAEKAKRAHAKLSELLG